MVLQMDNVRAELIQRHLDVPVNKCREVEVVANVECRVVCTMTPLIKMRWGIALLGRGERHGIVAGAAPAPPPGQS